MTGLIAAVQRLLPAPKSDVTSIVAGIEKPEAMARAEHLLEEALAQDAAVTERMAAIHERLNFESPLIALLSKDERDALVQENLQLNRQLAAVRKTSCELRAEIARQTTDYAEAIVTALAPVRRRAAEQLADAVADAESALAEIAASAKVLRKLGRPPAVSVPAMPFASGFRTLAERIIRE